MGPQKAAIIFAEKYPEAASFEVILYGSLAATGKGHQTDVAILDVLQPIAPTVIDWQPHIFLPFHPNGMTFKAYDSRNELKGEWTVYSVGGGALSEGENDSLQTREVYPLNTLRDIQQWCYDNGRSYWEYVEAYEGKDIWDFLLEVWHKMQQSVENGLHHEGVLPGPLNLPRKASTYYVKASGYKPSLQSRGLVFAYALAVRYVSFMLLLRQPCLVMWLSEMLLYQVPMLVVRVRWG